MGIEADNISLNLSSMMTYKEEGVQGNVKGIDFSLKKIRLKIFMARRRLSKIIKFQSVALKE